MKKEITVFLHALMFYTRIPCSKKIIFSPDYLNQATRYFPLIGWIVGIGITGIYGLSNSIFPPSISLILLLITSVLITGAFHEDGFADVCDGFGGGWTKLQILEIMKDSRSGAYALIGTILLYLLKFTTLYELTHQTFYRFLLVVILSHVLSRLAAVYIMFTESYVREDELSKAKPIAKELSTVNFLIAISWVIPIFILLQHPLFLLIILPVLLTAILLRRYFSKWIGGYTGDCLGAAQQITEIIVLLCSLVICKYI